MEALNLGWEFPIMIALAALLLFFGGCSFLIGIYCTALSLQGKFSARAVVPFWLMVGTAAFIGRMAGLESGVVLYLGSTPVLVLLFWYYERRQRLLTGESALIETI